MHITKLVLSLAIVSMAGQASAHKGLHLNVATPAAIRLTPAQTDTNPTALLDGIGGRTTQVAAPSPGSLPVAAPAKGTENPTHINRRH